MNPTAAKQTRPRITAGGVIAIFGVVVVLWIAAPIVMSVTFPEVEARGQAGDLYGSVNSLFSGLAFAGVIIAILLQREELALQRQELTYARQELRRSANAQEETQKALNKTIYAQTYKVALDILEAQHVIEARQKSTAVGGDVRVLEVGGPRAERSQDCS